MMKKITFISDTHAKHTELNLPGGDILLFAGDCMTTGNNENQLIWFLNWFSTQKYETKIFIAGNHDRFIQNNPKRFYEILDNYPDLIYLQDDYTMVDGITIYGSPWQPEFYNWAFNLPRGGNKLRKIWNKIPKNTDILITHGPPKGHLDVSGPPWHEPNLGCFLLRQRIDEIKPKIHVFGHIHGSYGYKENLGTHIINASVMGEDYQCNHDIITCEWDNETNEINFLN